MNSADVGERPPLCLCCEFVFRASHDHGIGEMVPCCLETVLPGLVGSGGVGGLMADSSLSESLWLYRSGDPTSGWGDVLRDGGFSDIPWMLGFPVVVAS